MKIAVVLFLLFIFASLGSALYYMVKDKGQSTRAVRSLTFRIGLSVLLFALLMSGTYLGFISL
ncbi:MAG: twin transmembrane helix small protein [Nitrosospira sp.]|nr:twin transmembrane helix small protein [Nitrosospira sp.]